MSYKPPIQLGRCAVIGNPIEHSLSPQIHQQFAQQVNGILQYDKIEGDLNTFEEQVRQFFKNGGKGLNVTLPFKARAYQLADIASPNAQSAATANTLWINEQQQICSDNTDPTGLITSLQKHLQLETKRVLLIGAGGAAKGVIASLLNNCASLSCSNRSTPSLQTLASQFPKLTTLPFEALKPVYDVIINASSASLTNQVPQVPTEIFKNSFCLDMFYNKTHQTAFTDWAYQHGAIKAIDGYEMLVGQAAASFKIWHGIKVSL